MADPTIDGTFALIYVQCLLDALTPKLFERVIAEARYPLEQVLTVTAPGQHSIPLPQQIALHHAVNRICGEATLRLLNQNMGVKIAQSSQTQQHSVNQGLTRKYATLSSVEQVGQTLVEFCASMGQMGVPLTVTAQAGSRWVITYTQCIACAGLQVSAPICGAMAVIIRMRMQNFCALPLVVQEIECCGVGDAECTYQMFLVE